MQGMKITPLVLALMVSSLPHTASAAPKRTSKAVKDVPIALPLKQIIPERLRLCVETTASGLGTKVLRAGNGPRPRDGQSPRINYIGYLASTGEVFDQNVNIPMPVNGVISGFAEGLKLTPAGGIMRLCIPAKLAYGDRATGPIPANSDLVFQIEVLEAN